MRQEDVQNLLDRVGQTGEALTTAQMIDAIRARTEQELVKRDYAGMLVGNEKLSGSDEEKKKEDERNRHSAEYRDHIISSFDQALSSYRSEIYISGDKVDTSFFEAEKLRTDVNGYLQREDGSYVSAKEIKAWESENQQCSIHVAKDTANYLNKETLYVAALAAKVEAGEIVSMNEVPEELKNEIILLSEDKKIVNTTLNEVDKETLKAAIDSYNDRNKILSDSAENHVPLEKIRAEDLLKTLNGDRSAAKAFAAAHDSTSGIPLDKKEEPAAMPTPARVTTAAAPAMPT